MSLSCPLGVDILERKKAGAFYRRHHGKLGELFSRGEMDFLKGSKDPQEAFAVIFAAKEAVFKALGVSWMGISGFKKIQIFPKKDFTVRLKRRFIKHPLGRIHLRVSFQKNTHHVIAICHPVTLRPCAGT